MAFTAGFSVNVGDPTKASDVDVLAANDDYLKNAIDTFIANDANNRVLTATGSGTANAESNLTFDGSTLTVTGTVSATTLSGNVTGGTISGTTGTFTSTISTSGGYVTVSGNPSAGVISSNGNGQIGGLTGNGLYMYGKGSTYDLALANANTSVALAIPTGGSATPRVYIPNSLGIGTSSPSALLHLYKSGSTQAGLIETDQSASVINFKSTGQTAGQPQVGCSGSNLILNTNGAERARIDSSGNMGLGVTPSAWLSTIKALQVGDGASVYNAGGAGGDVYYNNNWYVNSSSQNIYLNNGYALSYGQAGGEHRWFTAASGTAGNTVSFTQAMTLTNAGDLGLGSSSPASLSNYSLITTSDTSGGGLVCQYNGTSKLAVYSANNDGYYDAAVQHVFRTGGVFGGSTAMVIDSSQRVGIGTSSPAAPLHLIAGTPSTSADAFHISDGTYTNIVMRSGAADGEIRIGAAGTQRGRYAAQYAGTRTGHNFSLGTNDTTAVTIDTSQRVGINTTDTKNAMLYVEQDSTSTAGGIQIGRSAGGAAWAISNVASDLRFGFDGDADGTINVDAMTIDNVGRVGVGTSSPVLPLQLVDYGGLDGNSNQLILRNNLYYDSVDARSESIKSGYAEEIYLNNADGSITFRTSSSAATGANQALNTTERARITSDGKVGIGSEYPTYPLVVSNGGAAGYEFNVSGLNGGVNTVVYNRSTSAYVDSAHFVDNYYIYSGQTPAERFRVESTGVCAFMTPNINIRFNGTATQSVLTNNNGVEIFTGGYIWAGRQAASLYLNRAGTTGDVAVFYYNNTTSVGSISVTSSATAYNTSSDYRLKENLAPITGAVDRVNALQPRRFNFISDPNTTVDGFVAHEVSSVVPEAITGEKDAVDEDGNPEYQGIDQSKLVPLLTAAIQELTLTTQELTARIEALEAA